MLYTIVVVGLCVFWLMIPHSGEILLLFFIALVANQHGYFPWLKKPIPGLGGNKTYSAYIAGPLFGELAAALAWQPFTPTYVALGVSSLFGAMFLGTCVGFGVVVAEQLNSLYKRSANLESGASFWFDRVDWVVGASVMAAILLPLLQLWHVAWLVDLGAFAHYFGNKNSFAFNWRKTAY